MHPQTSDLGVRPPDFFQLKECGRSANSTGILTAGAPCRTTRQTARQPPATGETEEVQRKASEAPAQRWTLYSMMGLNRERKDAYRAST